jgi:NAD(P)-dependent dehydrogenase (short-subunit alcohol dehydrogenase family)
MTSPSQLAALRERLRDDRLDLLFVNAAIDRGNVPIGSVPTDMFAEVMITNAAISSSPEAPSRSCPPSGAASR